MCGKTQGDCNYYFKSITPICQAERVYPESRARDRRERMSLRIFFQLAQ
jgi:hypothetical protein